MLRFITPTKSNKNKTYKKRCIFLKELCAQIAKLSKGQTHNLILIIRNRTTNFQQMKRRQLRMFVRQGCDCVVNASHDFFGYYHVFCWMRLAKSVDPLKIEMN